METAVKTKKRKYQNKDDFTLSELFLNYYQNIIDPNEWNDFCEYLKRELPVSFRFSKIKTYFNEIKPLADKYINELDENVTKIPWFNEAYEIKMNKKTLKNFELYGQFRKFLVNSTELGYLCRQEAVSMLPPLLLDVQPHHKVLDMCAAPGSKTLQLIEMIHKDGLAVEDEQLKVTFPSGFVIANDENKARCFTLIHQIKRIPSPNYIVTSHDASLFPDLLLNNETNERLLFDRILCDVPCSGDGTIRKNIHASNFWKPTLAKGLHKLQCKILKRGIELLKPGGRLIYSTCSMNPLENEAVVVNALETFSGQIKLVETSHILPNLKYKPGMFPPSLKDTFKSEEITKFNLHYCTRIYPHLQDTGGFFIACFVKDPNCTMRSTVGNPKIQRNDSITNVVKGGIVVSSIKADDLQLRSILDFYGIESIPRGIEPINRSDNSTEANTIYLTTNTLANLIENNKEKLRVLLCGVRAIVKSHLKSYNNDSLRDYRIVQEIIYVFKSQITKRILTINQNILYELLMRDEVEKTNLTNEEIHSPDFVTSASSLIDQLKEISNGSVIFKVDIVVKISNETKTIYLAGYHSNKYIRLLVKKEVRKNYLLMLGRTIDEAEQIVNTKQTQKE